jgi:hypothetical protein
MARVTAVQGVPGPPAQPLHNARVLSFFYFLKKIMKLICGKENLRTFTAELKATVPAFYELARQAYACGLIDGLRAATLEIGAFSGDSQLTAADLTPSARFCGQCGHYRADQVGDGSGVGQCAQGMQKARLKWPGTDACVKFVS